ncbi:MAG: flagella basal body P-ring formation protein FlgA [Syntrophus sp. (in: bacteria)]|nr:flagella basal body P-ring formation protein FlgA [Syntrophus sp. (in: bacteria)]
MKPLRNRQRVPGGKSIMGNALHGTGRRLAHIALPSLLCALLLFVASGMAFSQERSLIEVKLINFINDFYSGQDEVQVKFVNTIPAVLKGKTKVKSINFSKVPDGQGEGICIVEYESKETREKSAYIPFKIYKKRHLFILRQGVKRGDPVSFDDFIEKDTYLTGVTKHPLTKDEITGKRFRKDLSAGTVITLDVLEDHILVQRGDIVNVLAENPRLVIHTMGKALDKGKIGETIRVKNMNSGKEVFGKVTGSNRVSVQF